MTQPTVVVWNQADATAPKINKEILRGREYF